MQLPFEFLHPLPRCLFLRLGLSDLALEIGGELGRFGFLRGGMRHPGVSRFQVFLQTFYGCFLKDQCFPHRHQVLLDQQHVLFEQHQTSGGHDLAEQAAGDGDEGGLR